MNFNFEILLPIFICVVMPVLIVWLNGRTQQNETNRKAEIMLKALENGESLNPDYFQKKHDRAPKTIKQQLVGKLTAASITSVLGAAFCLCALIPAEMWGSSQDPAPGFLVFGGILLAVGIAFFIVYFVSKNLLAKELEAEEKRLSEQK